MALAMITVAFAANNPDAKIAVHVRDHQAKLGCHHRDIYTCADIQTTVPDFSVDVFPCFFDLTEYLGCEYGMTWPAWTYSAAFLNCSDLVIGSIINPGDGASHTWLACQSGVCMPSVLWLYADGPGMICPCPHPVSGAIKVLDCAKGVDDPLCVFCAGVYGIIGDDPCEPTGTEASSWGEIKGMFE